MIRIQNILVPYDFSEFSRKALEYACELASQFHAKLHIIHVVEPMPTMFAEGASLLQETDAELTQSAQKHLGELPGREWSHLAVTRDFRVGTAFVEIIRYARENDIDVIVAGTHGRGAVAHMLLGSVAELVVRKAPCPVLIVREGKHDFVMP